VYKHYKLLIHVGQFSLVCTVLFVLLYYKTLYGLQLCNRVSVHLAHVNSVKYTMALLAPNSGGGTHNYVSLSVLFSKEVSANSANFIIILTLTL